MNLSAEQFADVLSSLNAPQKQGPAEKRRAPRTLHRCRIPVLFGLDPARAIPTVVTVRDISSRGVCIMHGQPVAQGTQFVTRLAGPSATAVNILCTVAHCRQQGKSLFVIGAEFTCILGQGAAPQTRKEAASDLERIRKSMLD